MPKTDPYAKLGGGALDQELFKQKPTPPPTPARDTSDTTTYQSKTQATPRVHPDSANKARKPSPTDVVTSSLQDVNLREWRDLIENTETHNSSLRLTTEEGEDVEDVIKELKRQLKVKTSLNEIARLGLLYLVHDFKKNRERSLIYQVKKS
jgi:hypothetical protein